MSNLRQAAQQALNAIEQGCSFDHFDAVIAPALRAALEQQPHAWAVEGSSSILRGEYAELDAKSEAWRIGGTCVAYPLYA